MQAHALQVLHVCLISIYSKDKDNFQDNKVHHTPNTNND